jgi:hypothetical protein
MRDVLGTVAGYGLLTVTGNEHRQMRRAMNPAFSLGNLMNRAPFSGLSPFLPCELRRRAETEMYFDSINVLLGIMRKDLDGAPDGKVMHMYDWSTFHYIFTFPAHRPLAQCRK